MSGDAKKVDIDEVRRMSRVSNSSFLRSFSLNSTGDVSLSSLKRKLPDDDDSEVSAKKDSRIGSPVPMSPWEFRRVRADLIDAQTQIVRLEDRIDQLHKKNKETVILFDQEKSDMKSQLENKSRTIEQLERKIFKLRSSEADRQADKYDSQRFLEKKLLDKEEKIQELSSINSQLRMELAEVEEHSDRTELALRTELEQVKLELVELQSAAEEGEEQVVNAQTRLAVALEDSKDLDLIRIDLQKAQDRVKELESEKEGMEEARAVAIALQHRVLRLNDIEAELKQREEQISQLKLAVQNKVMMEEQLHNMQIKMAALADREKEYIALKEKNFDIETEVERWCAMATACCGCADRDKLNAYITQIQDENLQVTLDKNSLNAKCEEVSEKLKEAMDKLASGKKAEEGVKAMADRLKSEVQILRRKVALVTRERDSYREQLDMFEKDLTVSGGVGGGGQERVTQLETMLQSYREQMAQLEEQLAQYRNDDVEGRIEATRKMEGELAAARAECERLVARKDQLENMLEDRFRSGNYLSPNTKVLHFRNNPLAAAEEQQEVDVAELRKELDRLRTRLRLVEAGERLDLTARAAADVEFGTTARVRELEEKLESMELKNKRLKEVFKTTSQDFRDVSYMLLGYRIDLVSNKLYRLTNMYSEDPNDHFMFQLTRGGMMEMLETAYTERLSDLVKEHLLENNSIPCFLSAVTLCLHGAGDGEDTSPEQASDDDQASPVSCHDDEDSRGSDSSAVQVID